MSWCHRFKHDTKQSTTKPINVTPTQSPQLNRSQVRQYPCSIYAVMPTTKAETPFKHLKKSQFDNKGNPTVTRSIEKVAASSTPSSTSFKSPAKSILAKKFTESFSEATPKSDDTKFEVMKLRTNTWTKESAKTKTEGTMTETGNYKDLKWTIEDFNDGLNSIINTIQGSNSPAVRPKTVLGTKSSNQEVIRQPLSPADNFKTKAKIEVRTPKGTVKRVLYPSLSADSSPQVSPKKIQNKENGADYKVAVNVNVDLKGVNGNNQTPTVKALNGRISPTKCSKELSPTKELFLLKKPTGHWLTSKSPFDDMKAVSSAMRVAVRLRPFNRQESEIESNPIVEFIDNTVNIKNTNLGFGFDSCLSSFDKYSLDFADQKAVYLKMGKPLLDHALDGYNVCLFAYGQTGSGKTYTMMGTDECQGIIPRFVEDLFDRIENNYDNEYLVKVSFMEIYNEKIYDLLTDEKKNLKVREDPINGPFVENLSDFEIKSEFEALELLHMGERRRAKSSNGLNDKSSRSHSIFTIEISQFKPSAGGNYANKTLESCISKVNLVDLAGSERIGKLEVDEKRRKEGNSINKSLFTLGKVINTLAASERSYIPYRDSVLTWLLKESLGGNSKTSMIATISPSRQQQEETLNTLRYASTARNIVNVVTINEDPKVKRIRELMEENERLRNLFDNEKSLDSVKHDDVAKVDNITKKQLKLLEEMEQTHLIRFQSSFSGNPESKLIKQIHTLFDEVVDDWGELINSLNGSFNSLNGSFNYSFSEKKDNKAKSSDKKKNKKDESTRSSDKKKAKKDNWTHDSPKGKNAAEWFVDSKAETIKSVNNKWDNNVKNEAIDWNTSDNKETVRQNETTESWGNNDQTNNSWGNNTGGWGDTPAKASGGWNDTNTNTMNTDWNNTYTKENCDVKCDNQWNDGNQIKDDWNDDKETKAKSSDNWDDKGESWGNVPATDDWSKAPADDWGDGPATNKADAPTTDWGTSGDWGAPAVDGKSTKKKETDASANDWGDPPATDRGTSGDWGDPPATDRGTSGDWGNTKRDGKSSEKKESGQSKNKKKDKKDKKDKKEKAKETESKSFDWGKPDPPQQTNTNVNVQDDCWD